MTVRVTHAKVSGKAQGADSTRVYGNHWDADHAVTGAAALAGGNALTGTQTVTTTGLTPALVTSQTGTGVAPVPGSDAGVLTGYGYNRIVIQDGVDASVGPSQGLSVEVNIAGANARGNKGGAVFAVSIGGAVPTDGTFSGATSTTSLIQSLYGFGGTAPDAVNAKGSIYGRNSYAIAYGPGPPGTWPGAIAVYNIAGDEINVAVKAGASVYYKSGLQIASLPDDAVQGSVYDGALSISAQFGSVGWKNGILFSKANGGSPVSATGALIATQDAFTVDRGIDLSSATITTAAFKSNGFLLNGSGAITTGDWAGTNIGATHGGTGLSSGTSGGVPYFNSTTTMATSGQLGGSAIIVGGGPGGPPATLGSLGTTSQVLHGNAAGPPTWGAVALATDISGFGTGVATALGLNVGSAGAPVTFNGAGGTPSSLTLTNGTGLPTTALTGALQAAQEPAHTGDVTNTAGSLALTLVAGNAGNLNSGTLLAARMPAHTGDVTSSAGSVALTLATAQPAVHTWALAQTFTVAPVFTDASGSRTALGLTASATAATGQLPGTATNDSATAGNVGESILVTGDSSAITATITIASPAVITMAGHLFGGVNAIVFTTSGALPTGITAGTTYYTGSGTTAGNTFNIATTVANAIAGTFINTSGSQSGTQTGTGQVVLTTSASIDGMGISLSAGNWQVWVTAEYSAAATTVTTSADISLSTTSVTRGSGTGNFGIARYQSNMTGNGNAVTAVAGPVNLKLSSTTTYFAVFRSIFTTATANYVRGGIYAVRIR